VSSPTSDSDSLLIPWIRDAKLADAPELADLHLRSDPTPSVLSKRLELWNHLLGGGSRRLEVWVALGAAGELIGFIAAGGARLLAGQFDAEVTALYISPERCRQRVGSALLAHAVKNLQEHRKARTFMAWVAPESPAAAFLRAKGWSFETSLTRMGPPPLKNPELAALWRVP